MSGVAPRLVPTITQVQQDLAIHHLLGTQETMYDALIELPGNEAFDEEDLREAIEDRIAECEECSTWCEINELADDEGEAISCEGCGGRRIAG